MKLQLIIQCIDTFGFKSPTDKLYFFINGNPIETIHKDNGFYSIIEKLPEKFILLIKSSVYYSYECTVNLKEKSNYLSVNLIRKIPPLHESAVWIDTVGYTKAVLGFGYFFLADSLKNTDIFISVDNPFRFCLEGRKFLIRDTQSLKEEFITIKKAENNFMNIYNIKGLTNNYDAEISLILPAFDLYQCSKIPFKKPAELPALIWLYDSKGNSEKIEIKN
ncbi:hypothetical protein [Porcipelethomonas sp.]|uniref:hypothetical protein n=1 Tax=Porcipelethomonas sp. TaxID=2981675 RepID=UPI00307893CA